MTKRWLYLLCGLLLTTSLWSQAAAPTVEVSPTSKIKYPNAADVLNPTPTAVPKATASQNTLTVKSTVALPVTSVPSNAASGWVWRWTVQGSESDVRNWAAQVSGQASVRALSPTAWEITVSAADWDPATSKAPQAQRAVLVRR